MAPLSKTRQGWTNETLANYLLRKVAFVSHPSTISDDIGADFFCTIFEIDRRDGKEFLIPKNSFLIQVKSNKKPLYLSVDFLINLEMPFFVGVVDQNELKLTLYSGECIPLFFSHIGRPKGPKIKIRLYDNTEGHQPPQLPFYEHEDGKHTFKFPKVTEIKADAEHSELETKAKALSRLCSRMYRNIAARANHEFVFLTVHGYDDLTLANEEPLKAMSWIFAGKDSAKTFRVNFLRRLAEACKNMDWIHEHIH